MRLRSPILARMPTTRIAVKESAGRVSLRILIGVPLLLFLLLIVLTVWFELLPERGLGALLYGFHDYIYLPFKGATYTRFFPESLVWWGITLTVLFFVTVSLLLDRSLIKGPHIILLRFCMHRPALHGYLIQGSLLLHRIGVRPIMVRSVAWREWEAAIIALSSQPLHSGSHDLCRRISSITGFYIQLDHFFSDDPLAHLRLLEMWHQAYLTVQLFGSEHELDYLFDLFEQFDSVSFGSFEVGGLTAAHIFDPAVVWRDVELLVRVGRTRIAARSNGIENAATWLTDQAVLVNAVETRRRDIVDVTVLKLERALALPIGRIENLSMYQPPELTNAIETIPIIGRITLNIAMQVAWLTNQPNLARAYVEALEALDMLLAATNLESAAIDKLKALIEEKTDPNEGVCRYMPLSAAHRLLARLELHKIAFQEQQWGSILRQEDAPVHRHEFAALRAVATASWQAAGPATADDLDSYQLSDVSR